MKVIGYVRGSTNEQAQAGLSLTAQADNVRAYCARYELELIEVIEEVSASAKPLDRPDLPRALDALRRGEVAGIVVAKLDRFTRSVADMAALIARCFGERAANNSAKGGVRVTVPRDSEPVLRILCALDAAALTVSVERICNLQAAQRAARQLDEAIEAAIVELEADLSDEQLGSGANMPTPIEGA